VRQISQTVAAVQLGLSSPGIVGKLEQGRGRPSYKIALKLSQTCAIPMEWWAEPPAEVEPAEAVA
jgi:transcriptional regulator with XRE-family HTH domain